MIKNNLEVNFYLAPSKISGVGLFSRVKFKKGDELDKLITDDSVFIKKSEDTDLLNKLCVKTEDGWWCPSDFSRPSFWWYINHSKKPNVNVDKNNKFTVAKEIKPGQEITIDYEKLDKDESNDNANMNIFSKNSPRNFYQ